MAHRAAGAQFADDEADLPGVHLRGEPERLRFAVPGLRRFRLLRRLRNVRLLLLVAVAKAVALADERLHLRHIGLRAAYIREDGEHRAEETVVRGVGDW